MPPPGQQWHTDADPKSIESKSAQDKDDSLFRKPTIAPKALRRTTPPKAKAKIRKRENYKYVENVNELEHVAPMPPDEVQDWTYDEAVHFLIHFLHEYK